jgi:hypothetical protein
MHLPIWSLIALTFWLRIWGSFHDGVSDRGRVFTMPDTHVGWISWHVINWMRRDFVILFVYLVIAYHYIAPAFGTSGLWTRIGLVALALGALALVHKYLHDWLYNWAVHHRHKFLRGPQDETA